MLNIKPVRILQIKRGQKTVYVYGRFQGDSQMKMVTDRWNGSGFLDKIISQCCVGPHSRENY